VQKLTADLSLALAYEITLSYQGNSQKVLTYYLPFFQKEIHEKSLNEPEKIIEIFNKTFAKALNNYDIEQFIGFDKYVLNITENASEEEAPIINNLGNSLSLATILAMAKMNNSNAIDFINQTIPMFKLNNSVIPDLGFVLFKTGKNMNSKVKFERWILFINNSKKIPFSELKEIISKIYSALKKFLTAGKAGEGGMRLNDEGSYYPPVDAMNDIIKLMENIIIDCGGGDNFYYGIDCNGDNYYSAETNTYEMDGFKKPPDNDQMIDFYIKLCKDHPLLKYLEDPLSNEDLRGYSKLMDKFSQECPDVKIALKRLVNDKIGNLSNIVDKEDEKLGANAGGTKMNTLNPLYRSRLIHNDARPEDIKEELTELEKKKKAEEEERKRLEEEEKKRLEEEEAKRLEEEEAKNAKATKKKPEAKKPEVKKPNVKKTEEELKKEKEEEEKSLPPPIPFTKLKDVAIHFGNFSCLTNLNEFIQKLKQNGIGLTIYDNVIESSQSGIIDFAIGLRFNRIILHGFTIKPDRKEKMIEYLDMIEKIY